MKSSHERGLSSRERPEWQGASGSEALQLQNLLRLLPDRERERGQRGHERLLRLDTYLSTENTLAIFPMALILFLITSFLT